MFIGNIVCPKKDIDNENVHQINIILSIFFRVLLLWQKIQHQIANLTLSVKRIKVLRLVYLMKFHSLNRQCFTCYRSSMLYLLLVKLIILPTLSIRDFSKSMDELMESIHQLGNDSFRKFSQVFKQLIYFNKHKFHYLFGFACSNVF